MAPVEHCSAAFLVPRRFDDGPRDALWAHCRAEWDRRTPDIPICEGHHLGPGMFNRSRAMNRARAGVPDGTQVLVILDSDCLLDAAQVLASIALAHRTQQVVVGFEWWYGLDDKGTAKILGGFRGDWHPHIRNRWHDSHSALVAVPVGLWDQVGGFDERFEGWGLEDSAFVLATDTISRHHLGDRYVAGAPRRHQTFGWPVEPHLRVAGECWHLWHPRSEAVRDRERNGNRRWFAEYQDAGTIDEMRRVLARAAKAKA